MKKAEFERWGAGHSHLPNLVSAAKVIEERLGKLGFEYADLEEAYQSDGFNDIFGRLDDLRVEFQNGNTSALDGLLPNSPSENKLFQLASYKSRFQKYKDFMDGKPRPVANKSLPLAMAAFERLKTKFLQKHPDFTNFAGTRSFAEAEGDYKSALVAEAGRIIADMTNQPAEALGAALIELLAGRTELPSNLIDWRAQKVFDNVMKTHPDLLEREAGRLARADDAEAAINEFVETVWPVMRGDLPSNPYAESRMYPTMLRALVDPQSVLPIRSTPTDNASRMLLGKPAFANAPLSPAELRDTTEMAHEMMRIMEEEWGWAPRDLWDVQGFIWETCQKNLKDDEMTDEELLHLFDSCDYFRTRRVKWTDEQTASFCRMARKVHDLGLDWYRTGIPQIRFGRRNKDASRASATLASFDAAPGRIRFTHSARDLGLTGMRFDCDPEGERAFYNLLDDKEDAIRGWLPPVPEREGLWPSYSEDDEVDEFFEEHVGSDIKPSNLILYGPPGTGKTYHTMEVSVRLCGERPARDRGELREQYERLRKEKRIEFVTFHQNFSYEEFVEGLRPETGIEEGDTSVGFRLKPKLGIFRNICQLAQAAADAAKGGQPFDMEERRVFKMSLGRAGIEDHIFQDAIDNSYAVLGWGGEIDWTPYDTYEAIHARWNEDHPGTNGNDANIIQTTRFRADMKEGDLIVVSHGNKLIRAIGVVSGPYRYDPSGTREYNHRRDVEWLKVFREPIDYSAIYDVPFMQWSCYLLKDQHLNRNALANLLPGAGGAAADPKQYVLVIDEINRANISKVFGELITLIEPDKRIGMDEELRIRLPYSEDEEKFGVPANLHIVGTMNTADRSIMQIDTALRRRFRFEEMEPKSSLLETIDGIDLSRVLDTINARIEYLLDRDHAVGHAFFMGDGGKDRVAIDQTMRFKIIPLLQEYFFDDWRNIAAVLGAGFVSGKRLAVPPGIPERGERTRWTIRWQENGISGFPENAYDLLLKGTEAEVDQGDGPQEDSMDDADDEA